MGVYGVLKLLNKLLIFENDNIKVKNRTFLGRKRLFELVFMADQKKNNNNNT